MYKPTRYSYLKARLLGVTIKPAENPNKKLDVFKKGIKIATIGDINYLDYPNFVKLEKLKQIAPGTAKMRRSTYLKRHAKTIKKKFSPSWYASKILW
jgi:hypothetical protein